MSPVLSKTAQTAQCTATGTADSARFPEVFQLDCHTPGMLCVRNAFARFAYAHAAPAKFRLPHLVRSEVYQPTFESRRLLSYLT